MTPSSQTLRHIDATVLAMEGKTLIEVELRQILSYSWTCIPHSSETNSWTPIPIFVPILSIV
ncbi:hypothetical protein [Devriesea agamarum]|uniref:hypothetical protein n=1 Tax=Devriesea agamarum TaxID=472569 RepID=UPI00071C267C|nr:hypothetical protein [Devriesea agamarum]